MNIVDQTQRVAPGALGHVTQPSQLTRVVLSCMIGNALEWYDFALYGFFAILIGNLFFPSQDPLAPLIASFGLFAAGFVMRPLGAVLFGHIGDRQGRKKALLWSIYLMAIPTALIGLLPTYEQIGWLAPVLLTVIRLLQGLSMGGEFTGSMIFIVEHAPSHRRGFYGSWPPFSALAGVIIGSAFATLLTRLLSNAQLVSWGWRLPFVMSIVGGAVGSFMRRKIADPEHFQEMKAQRKSQTTPLEAVFKSYKKRMGLVILIDMTVAIGFFITVTFVVSYLEKFLGFSKVTSLAINTCSMLAFAAAIPVSGWLVDRYGRKPIMMGAALCFFCFSVSLFQGFAMGNKVYAYLSHIALGIIMGMYFAPLSAVLVELFPAHVRYSGMSIAHNVSMAFFGGTAPYVVTHLMKLTDWGMVPAYYLMAASLLSLIGLLCMRDRFREDLET